MRFFLIAIVTIATVVSSAPAKGQELPELQVNSKRYILMDAQTGHVYAQKDARDEVPIASLTKIFTAVQALEMAAPNTPVTTTTNDLFGPAHTLMGFGPNETYTLEDMIYGMLLPSGNDAAYAIARTLGQQPGDTAEEAVQRFMERVNQRALDMGLENTHLITPSGWGVPGHHSSAWDVAAMMQHALEFPLIEQAISTRSYTTSNGLLTVTNTNKLLNSYESLVGGKTGYDDDAGWCLVGVAESEGRRMIAVTLDGIAPDDWYDDNRVLLEYGFTRETQGAASDWDGDLVAWSNPSVALVERSASGEVALAGIPVDDSPAMMDSPDPAIQTAEGPDGIDRLATGSIAATIVALTVILGMRGMMTFNHRQPGRSRPDG
jgi:serine-type D-Ala-D-Ala carboxypeptidase (penicillin-binding protein 5/6)